MKRYFKLELDKCNFWQSEIRDGSKVYFKRDFKRRSVIPLNQVFFRQDVDGMFTEVTTGKRIKVEAINNKLFIVEPLGIDIDHGAFSSATPSEISGLIRDIRVNNLGSEYLDIIDDLLVNSDLCEKASLKKKKLKEESSLVRKFINKFHKKD